MRWLLAALTVLIMGPKADAADVALKTIKIVSRTETEMITPSGHVGTVGEETTYVDLIHNRYRIESTIASTTDHDKSKKTLVNFSDGQRLYTIKPNRPMQATYREVKPGIAMWTKFAAAGLTPIGEETVAGHPCKIYEDRSGKTWVWNDIPLKYESRVSSDHSSVKSEAIRVEEDIPLDESLFRLPPNVEATRS